MKRKSRRFRRRMRIDIFRFSVFVLSLVMFIIGATLLVRYFTHSISNKKQNALLQEKYEALVTMTPEPTATPEAPVVTPLPVSDAQENVQDEPSETPTAVEPVITLAPSYHTVTDALNPKLMQFYDINKDITGWLEISDVISLPVVYRDNSFYVTHDFYKKENSNGCLFVDVNMKPSASTQVVVVHGHNMIDRSMFGQLHRYLNGSYMKKHGFATFETISDSERYVVCAAGQIKLNEYVKIFQPSFESEDAFNSYVTWLRSHMSVDSLIGIDPCDPLLILSTCCGNDNERLIVLFRGVRAEDREDLLQLRLDASFIE